MQELKEIEFLVNRANFRNEYLETELQHRLEKIFLNSVHFPASHYNYLKKLLFMIGGIEKSSNFGYYFYETLHENPFPFCREVLKSAVYNERYYNLNDKALKSYVRVYLIDTGFNSKAILDFDEVIPEGHGYHYFDAFAVIERKKSQLQPDIKPCFYDLMYAVMNRDIFPMTQKKSATIISFLQLKEFKPVLIGKAYQIMQLKERSSDQVLVLMHLIKAISLLEDKPLSNIISDSIHELISCRCNGSLPGKYDTRAAAFHEYVNHHIEVLLPV
jgi:hypothetical protein